MSAEFKFKDLNEEPKKCLRCGFPNAMCGLKTEVNELRKDLRKIKKEMLMQNQKAKFERDISDWCGKNIEEAKRMGLLVEAEK